MYVLFINKPNDKLHRNARIRYSVVCILFILHYAWTSNLNSVATHVRKLLAKNCMIDKIFQCINTEHTHTRICITRAYDSHSNENFLSQCRSSCVAIDYVLSFSTLMEAVCVSESYIDIPLSIMITYRDGISSMRIFLLHWSLLATFRAIQQFRDILDFRACKQSDGRLYIRYRRLPDL